jgi:intraflagellar transport protein 46
LFQYILRYTPQTIELDHRLKPFIPDYIPAVGDIDAFIKIPKPSGGVKSNQAKANTIADGGTLGLSCLDEPAAKQSDPTVLDLTLRAVVKQTSAKAVSVKTIDEAEKNTKAVEKWIKDISDLHRSKPPPTVHYSK